MIVKAVITAVVLQFQEILVETSSCRLSRFFLLAEENSRRCLKQCAFLRDRNDWLFELPKNCQNFSSALQFRLNIFDEM